MAWPEVSKIPLLSNSGQVVRNERLLGGQALAEVVDRELLVDGQQLPNGDACGVGRGFENKRHFLRLLDAEA